MTKETAKQVNLERDEKNWNDRKRTNTKRREERRDNDMFKKNTSKGFVAIALLALLTFGASISVSAAPRFDKGDVREIARRNGFEYGIREGRSDSNRGNRFEMKDSRAYRDGMAGYRYEFGYERDYRNAFRDGFEAGYRNGFNSYQRRGGWNGGSNGGSNNGPWNRRNTFFFPTRRF
jgi:hypothetical protein